MPSLPRLTFRETRRGALRSLRGVLNCAGSLKRTTDMPEELIVLRAIRDMNLPKFIKADAELFRLLLSDLFPSLELPPFEPGDLGRQIDAEMLKAGLQLNPVILQKVRPPMLTPAPRTLRPRRDA